MMAVHSTYDGPATALSRLVEDYLNHCQARGLSPRTDKQYSYPLRVVFLPWCAQEGIERPEHFDRRVADRFSAYLLGRTKPDGTPASRYTVAAYTRPVRQMLAWARREGEQVEGQPQMPRRPKLVKDVLTRDEVDVIERAAVRERDRVIIRVFGDCGLRLSELAALRSEDVVRSGRQAYLNVRGKGNRARPVPVAPALLRRLERLIDMRPQPRATDAIFVASRRSPDGRYDALTTDGVHQALDDAVLRSGIRKRVYPHLLRHSWMTEMVRSGMSPIQLSFIAGASPQVIAECYTHLTKADAYESMMRALSGLGGRPAA